MKYRLLGANTKVKDIIEEEEALQKAIKLGSDKGSMDIIRGLTALDAVFDIFLLPDENKNGSFNSLSDQLAPSSKVAKKTYEDGGYSWLQRPTIFWNAGFSAKVYSDVTGVENYEEPVGFRRLTQVKDIPGDKRTLILRTPSGRGGAQQAAAPKKALTAFQQRIADMAAKNNATVGTSLPSRSIDKVVITAREIVLPPWVVLMHELGHAKQYFELAKRLNAKAHDPEVETAWGDFAFSPGRSSEPDNVGRHEKPITDFLFNGHRKRYYHDAFHFGAHTGYNGWSGGALNYTQNLNSNYDNFIFRTEADQRDFMNATAALPIYDPAGEDAGYFWSRA